MYHGFYIFEVTAEKRHSDLVNPWANCYSASSYLQNIDLNKIIIMLPKAKSSNISWPGMVVHICNLSYLGSRDWEDHGSRPALAKS
jgi:hypothetical protein